MPDFFKAGGTLSPTAPSYIRRQADEELFQALLGGEFCYVLSSRQVGKSSMVLHTIARLRAEKVAAVNIDLTGIGTGNTRDQWYFGLLDILGRQLGLQTEIEAFLDANERLDSLTLWMQTLETVVLAKLPGCIVVFIDEIEVVRSLSFSTDEFFAAIRACYNRRAENPDYERLTFCLVGSSTPAQLVANPDITPFNIGRGIELTDFTPKEAESFAQQLSSMDGDGPKLLERILYWTHGHPYLTQRLCAELSRPGKSPAAVEEVDALCWQIFFSEQEQSKDTNIAFVSNRILMSGEDTGGVLDLYRQILTHKTGVREDPASPLQAALRLSGIARREQGTLRVRNRLYASVFNRKWIHENLPDAEQRRIEAATRRNTFRIAGISAIVITLVSIVAGYIYFQNRRLNDTIKQLDNTNKQLEAEQSRTRRLLYDADMNAIEKAYNEKNYNLAFELLWQNASYTERGFEWGYWYRKMPCLRTLEGHSGSVSSVAISSDGKRIVTGSDDKTARIWDAETGKELKKLEGHNGSVFSVAISSDGKRIVTGGNVDTTARIWDAETGKELKKLEGHSSSVYSVTISSDGKRIVTGSLDTTARIWDAETGKELKKLEGHNGYVFSVAISTDGKRIVTGGDDKTARIWDAETGKELKKLEGHSSSVYSVAISSDGKRIVTGSSDKMTRIWDAETGKELKKLEGHSHYVTSIAISSDGKRIVTGSLDKTARIWDAETGKEPKKLEGHSNSVTSIAISTDGKRIVTGSWDTTARIWDAETGKELKKLEGHSNSVTSIAISTDGKRIVTGGDDKTARIWDSETGKELKKLEGHNGSVFSVTISSDGKRIVTGSDDKTARIWDAETGKELKKLEGHSDRVTSVAISTDGKRIVTGGFDDTARIWDAETGKELKKLEGHSRYVYSVAISTDGKRIVTGSDDKTARIWDAETGKELKKLEGHSGSVAISSNGKRIVSGSYDNTAILWLSETPFDTNN